MTNPGTYGKLVKRRSGIGLRRCVKKGSNIMTTAKIRINTIEDVKNFVSVVTGVDFDVDIVSGRYAIDAKSIMGIFSLDLSKELELRIHSDNCGEFLDDIKSYIV